MTGVPNNVSALDTMAAHFRKINNRLASLERAASSGGGGGGGTQDVLWVGPNAPTDPIVELWWDTDETASSVPTLPEADARYVNVDGDTMTGTLTVNPPASITFGTTPLNQRLNLYGASFGIGIQSSTLYLRTSASAVGSFSFHAGGVHSDTLGDPGAGGVEIMRMSGGNGATARTLMIPGRVGSQFLLGDSVTTGPRLRMHLPASGEICYIDFEGDTVGAGDLQFRSGSAGIMQLENALARFYKSAYIQNFSRIYHATNPLQLISDGAGPFIAFYDGASVDSIGNRRGYIGFTATDLFISNEKGTYNRYYSGTGNLHLFYDGSGTEETRIEGASQAWGRTTGQYATIAGVDIRNDGRFIATRDTTGAYNWILNIGAADAASSIFLTLRRGSGSPVQIGSITQVATTGVAFNTTSHGPWKGNVRDLDDDEALARVMLWRPVAYQWKFDEDGHQSEDGEPSGDEQHGFIAQELVHVQPHAVAVGWGTQADQREWQTRKAAHEAAMETDSRLSAFNEPEPFMPWGADNGKLVPDLAAAVQALIRKVNALEAR